MAKLNLSFMYESLRDKYDELMDKIQDMKNNVNLSENTVRTQTNLKRHEARSLLIIQELVMALQYEGKEEVAMTESSVKGFESLVMLTETRKKGSIILHEGDNVFQVMEEHENLTMSKLKDLAERQGFKLNKGIIVR